MPRKVLYPNVVTNNVQQMNFFYNNYPASILYLYSWRVNLNTVTLRPVGQECMTDSVYTKQYKKHVGKIAIIYM